MADQISPETAPANLNEWRAYVDGGSFLLPAEVRALISEVERLRPYVEAFRREETRADKLARELDDLRGHAQSSPIALIDRRLEDLAEANALYGKDQRLSAPDKIARNDREISWLKDLRSTLSLADTSTTREGK